MKLEDIKEGQIVSYTFIKYGADINIYAHKAESKIIELYASDDNLSKYTIGEVCDDDIIDLKVISTFITPAQYLKQIRPELFI
jgi:hypothetical protein